MEVDNTHPSSFRADDIEISTINYLMLHKKISVLYNNTICNIP